MHTSRVSERARSEQRGGGRDGQSLAAYTALAVFRAGIATTSRSSDDWGARADVSYRWRDRVYYYHTDQTSLALQGEPLGELGARVSVFYDPLALSMAVFGTNLTDARSVNGFNPNFGYPEVSFNKPRVHRRRGREEVLSVVPGVGRSTDTAVSNRSTRPTSDHARFEGVCASARGQDRLLRHHHAIRHDVVRRDLSAGAAEETVELAVVVGDAATVAPALARLVIRVTSAPRVGGHFVRDQAPLLVEDVDADAVIEAG